MVVMVVVMMIMASSKIFIFRKSCDMQTIKGNPTAIISLNMVAFSLVVIQDIHEYPKGAI